MKSYTNLQASYFGTAFDILEIIVGNFFAFADLLSVDEKNLHLKVDMSSLQERLAGEALDACKSSSWW